jgi:RNA 2',3'-cyclic 3'-phosphodiesterase
MPRLFIGVKCINQEYLSSIQTELKKILPRSRINWVDPSLFHITLKFLGDVEETLIPAIVNDLKPIKEKYEKIILIPERVGIFGPKHQPRVIWFGYSEDAKLASMQYEIEYSLSRHGFESEKKRFTPHLTLGRIKNIEEINELNGYLQSPQKIIDQKFHAEAFQLFKSILKKDGPAYQVIENFNLKR